MPILALETSCDDTCAAVARRAADPLQRHLLAGRGARALRRRRPRGRLAPPPRARQRRSSRRRWPRPGAALDDVDAIAVTARPGPDRRAARRGQHREGAGRAAPAAADPGRPPAGPRRRQLPRARSARAALPLPDRQRRPHAARRRCATTTATRCSARRSTTPPARRFDKVARLLGLGYPGGPAIERLARGGRPRGVRASRWR